MPVTKVEIRRGTYYDSAVLMQLQAQLKDLDNVLTAAVMMGTVANKDLLKQNGLLTDSVAAAHPDDLIIAVAGTDSEAATSALTRVDELLTRRQGSEQTDYRPKSLSGAVAQAPDADWVLVSVPGRYAAGVVREALDLGKHVFLYSDNVSLENEISLKTVASSKGLMVMGPDCGTASINGAGLGFANQVRRGPVGLVGASGTGLQQVMTRIHELGGGVTHAIGTGGRDLRQSVGAITARQGLNLLSRDPETGVIVIISKPPSPKIVATLLADARQVAKPVVVYFTGYSTAVATSDETNIRFATSMEHAAKLAVSLTEEKASSHTSPQLPTFAAGQKYLRGLFSGGTLAYEALLALQNYLPEIYSNVPLKAEQKLENPTTSKKHTIIDLGEDEFTVGRLHPMMDNTLRLERLAQEAADPEVAVILLDVVLGHGAHPDPAAELVPAIQSAPENASDRELKFVVVVVGTNEDPQDMSSQVERFKAAGAHVETNINAAADYVGRLFSDSAESAALPPVDLSVLQRPLDAINVGLESFFESLQNQDASVLQVDWKPPAGGNEKLMSILERMKKS